MHITHSYAGTTLGSSRYLFFALYEDYTDFGRRFIDDFRLELQRMARNLQDLGVVVEPFAGDIEVTRSHVLEKPWTDDELDEIRLVPSLLVIDRDFDTFSPREHPWIALHFGERAYGGHEGAAAMSETMKAITEAVERGDQHDLYDVAERISRERPELGKVFEAKPGVFGFSVDLLAAGAEVRDWFRGRRRRIMGERG